MATYVIGDLQGCLDGLQRLLERCRFDPASDRLVFAGDLVARGPDSVGTLRFVHSLGSCATTVLGNHDLALIGIAHGHGRPRDGLEAVLEAPDADTLLAFLLRQPLLWQAAEGLLVVHAGLAPQWSGAQALQLAAEVEAMLRDPAARAAFLPQMYGNMPARWDDALSGSQRLRFAINCFTRMRYCSADGTLDFAQKGPPGEQPAGLVPWFAAPQRRSRDLRIVFGHWSSLGRVAWPEHRVWGLDTGCVWGGPLSALRLDDEALIQVNCPKRR